MITLVHDTNDGCEYWSKEMLANERVKYPYVVLSHFAQPLNAENFGNSPVAKVLYKGESESDAKNVWKSNNALENFLIYGDLCLRSEDRRWLDVSDLDYYVNRKPGTNSINYPIGWFKFDEKYGKPVLTKELIQTNEDVWYLIRVHDIDLDKLSYIGQIVLKSISKLEAVQRWEKDAADTLNTGLGRHYYIFNPKEFLSN